MPRSEGDESWTSEVTTTNEESSSSGCAVEKNFRGSCHDTKTDENNNYGLDNMDGYMASGGTEYVGS